MPTPPPPHSPVQVIGPQIPAIPLVCDSPHSGSHYPADYGYSVALSDLRKSEDTHVQWLWDAVPQVGGTLIHATFPRSYVDANRHLGDIDLSMLADDWPGEVTPTARSLALGNGLVSSLTTSRRPIYSRPLSAREVAGRIEKYWQPYRDALTQVMTTAGVAGRRWHLNLHSMPSNAYERLGRVAPGPLADVVLGDLHGVSCSQQFMNFMADAFRRRGYTVSINDPYAGQDLLRQFGHPEQGFESLQIEINRAIYLDEETRELLPQATVLRQDITDLLGELAAHIQSRFSSTQG